MPTVAMATSTPAEKAVGMPRESTATSSPTRDSTSPRPTCSIRALGIPSTARTAASRSCARRSAPSRPIRYVETAVAAAPSSAAAAIRIPVVTRTERPSPSTTPSTTRPSRSTGSTWSAAPATVVNTVAAVSQGTSRQRAATHRVDSPPAAVRRVAAGATRVSVLLTREPDRADGGRGRRASLLDRLDELVDRVRQGQEGALGHGRTDRRTLAVEHVRHLSGLDGGEVGEQLELLERVLVGLVVDDEDAVDVDQVHALGGELGVERVAGDLVDLRRPLEADARHQPPAYVGRGERRDRVLVPGQRDRRLVGELRVRLTRGVQLLLDALHQRGALVLLAQRLGDVDRVVLPGGAEELLLGLGAAHGRGDLGELVVGGPVDLGVDRDDQVGPEGCDLLVVGAGVAVAHHDLGAGVAPLLLHPGPLRVDVGGRARRVRVLVDHADRLDAEREDGLVVGVADGDDPLGSLGDLGGSEGVLHGHRKGPGRGRGGLVARPVLAVGTAPREEADAERHCGEGTRQPPPRLRKRRSVEEHPSIPCFRAVRYTPCEGSQTLSIRSEVSLA